MNSLLLVSEVVMMPVVVVELLDVREDCLSKSLKTDLSNRKMILIVEEGPA